jgi:steroid delta-isomerase-like uncharacterized protein
MSAENEAVVRRYFEQMSNERKNELFSAGDKVVVRWTGSGTHVAEVNGIPATGKQIAVDAISIHQIRDGKIAESWEVWDTLGFLQQVGVVPTT